MKNEETVEITGILEKDQASNRWVLTNPHRFISYRNFNELFDK